MNQIAGATPEPDPADRRFAALRGCDRILSAARTRTLRERLTELAADSESVHDLDERLDLYGDGVVAALERRVAELLGKPDAAFFPAGTMAQQAVLQHWSENGNRRVAIHPLSHPERHENRAYARLSGLQTVWPTLADRLPTAAELRDFGADYDTLMLELPLRDAGFILPTWDELTELVAVAREQGVRVHFDGARLWESVFHLDRTLPQIAELADSVYVSCYKALGGLSGALVAADRDCVRELRNWRHRYGGRLYQQFPAALAALVGLDRELPRLASYVEHARTVAEVLAEAPGARINPAPPHTHQFQLWLPHPAETLNDANLRLAEEHRTALFGLWSDAGPVPGHAMTEVTIAATALDWTAKDVTAALETYLSLL